MCASLPARCACRPRDVTASLLRTCQVVSSWTRARPATNVRRSSAVRRWRVWRDDRPRLRPAPASSPATIPHAVHWDHCPPLGLRPKRLRRERLRRASRCVTHLFEDSLCALVTPDSQRRVSALPAAVKSAQLMPFCCDTVKNRRSVEFAVISLLRSDATRPASGLAGHRPASRRLSRMSSAPERTGIDTGRAATGRA